MASAREIQAGKAVVIMGLDMSPLARGLDAAKAKLQSAGKFVASFGASVAAAGALITAPFLYGLHVFEEWGAEMRNGMRETGLSFRELDLLVDGFRVSAEELSPALAKMDAWIVSLAEGSADAAQAAERMGVSLDQLMPMSLGDRAIAIADGINKIGDASLRVATQRGVFGRRGLALNILGGAEGVRGRAERVAELQGPTLHSEEAYRLSEQFVIAQKEMGMAVKGLWASLGAAAAPAMIFFLESVTRMIVQVRELADEFRPLLSLVFRFADVAVTVGGAIVGFGAAIYAASYAFAFMSGAISIVAGAMAFLWPLVTFAASGFGILTAITWLYNSAVAVASLLTYGWIIPLVALGVAAIAVQVAIVGVIALFVGFVAYMLVTRGIVEAVWDHIVEVFTNMTDLITDLFGTAIEIWMLAFTALFDFVTHLFGGERGAIGDFFAYLVDTATNAVGFIVGLFSRIGDAISGAVSRTVDGFTRMFGGLVDTATSAFQGIKDAFAVGDWEMIWEIVKVSALLAWEDISNFVEDTWIDWKNTFFEVAADLGVSLAEAFELAWVAIRETFLSTWSTIRVTVFRTLQEMTNALADYTSYLDSQLADTIRSQARTFGIQANRAGVQEDARRRDAESADIGAWFTRQMDAVNAEMAREERRLLETELANEGRPERRAGLQEQLDALNLEAMLERGRQEENRMQQELPPTVNDDWKIGKNQVFGTFSKDLSGYFGAGGAMTREMTAAERAILVAEQQLEAERVQQRLLEELARRPPGLLVI